jgi:hypothetical protein
MRVILKTVTVIMFWLFLGLTACSGDGAAKSQLMDTFSFIAAGDSRTEVYLTGGKAQEGVMRDIIMESYGLDKFPNAKTIRASFKFTYDTLTGELSSVEAPGRYIDFYRDGWSVLRRTYKDGKLDGIIMRETGRKWIFQRIAMAINNGALFFLHGGDFILDGTLGKTIGENPYWQLFQEELVGKIAHLPPLRIDNIELEGRIFGVIGNHETYRDKNASGFFSVLTWLTKLGMRPDLRIYSFPFRNCFFIFLDCGPSADPVWDSVYPDFKAQMEYLTAKLEDACKKKSEHVFVSYHKPTFIQVGHGPLPEDQSPHKYLKKYANKLNICVFNSHSHTTEQYLVDGVNYFVLGGGGATQNLEPSSHPSHETELYWQGEPRMEEYNYLEVKVKGAEIECLVYRFRPDDTRNPVSVVKVLPR